MKVVRIIQKSGRIIRRFTRPTGPILITPRKPMGPILVSPGRSREIRTMHTLESYQARKGA